LALGVLVLQGCVTNDYKRTGVNKKTSNWYSNLETNTPILLNPKKFSYKNDTLGRYYKERDVIASLDKKTLMKYACNNGTWDDSNFRYVMEAKRQYLECKLEDLANTFSSLNTSNNQNLSVQSNNKSKFDITKTSCALMPSMMSCRFLRKSGIELCESISGFKRGVETYDNYSGSLKEAKRRGLDCGVEDNNQAVIASKPKIKANTKPNISLTELDAEKQKRLQLEQELAEIKNKQKQEQQRIDTDNQIPNISAFTKLNGSNAIISGRVTDNTEVSEVLIDGEQLSLTNNGTFKTELYIPRNGLNIEIVAYDRKGNKASKLIKIKRGNIQQASGPTFDTLNPSGKTVKSNPNALALIIGVADYEKTNADALYADKDAQQFYDYATMKLGIPSANIKELVNDKADLGEILINVKDWLRRSAKPNKSDIYIYFAGHGLASDDGTKMYLLPYDGRPRLLENTAVLRDKLFADLSNINPRSVTVFLDTCYSGTTRGTDMLVSSRPIMIKAKEQSIPNNFTVFSAAAGDQTSKPLEEAKHGMFSYFLMKGMEGDADTNADNKITAQELHNYVKENVTQQSSGSQTPELQGDKDRVLVQFN